MTNNSPYWNFPGIIAYDFLKEDHMNNFHTKNQEDSQQRLEVISQKPSKLSILAKNEQILTKNGPTLATNCQILAISEFFWHIYYEFLREDHKGSFHTKNQENLQRRLGDIGQKHSKMAILTKYGQILTIFGIKIFLVGI